MKKILVTGATGFIGTKLVDELVDQGYSVICAVRSIPAHDSYARSQIQYTVMTNIDSATDWKTSLQGVDTVIHLAARVHIMHDKSADQLDAFRQVNTYGTERLARQAAEQGVKRFIYISSIKVNGEETNGKPFTATDAVRPEDPYAISKYEAEELLHDISRTSGMEVVIIRPPLVYGPGVKANFLRFIRLANSGIPVPFSSINNSRSMVSVTNLVDLIINCIDNPAAANQLFLVSDGTDWSTPELFRAISTALHRPSRLFSCPVSLLRLFGLVTGQKHAVERLVGSSQIDMSLTCQCLGWQPEQTSQHAIQQTVEWYRYRNQSCD